MELTTIILIIVFFILSIQKHTSFVVGRFNLENTLPFRGLLALFIVFHHLGLSTNIPLLSPIFNNIGNTIVSLFFFMSGYGLCKSYMKKGPKYLDGFLWRRIGKLGPKFLFLTILMIAFGVYFLDLDIDTQLLEMCIKGYTPLPNSWFIIVIIYVYLSFFLSTLICKSYKAVGLSLLTANLIYIVLFAFILKFPLFWSQSIIFINLGYFFALYEKIIVEVLNKLRIPLVCFFIIVLLVGVMSSIRYFEINRLSNLLAVCKFMYLLIVTVSAYIIISLIGFRKSSFFIFLGSFSLELYLVHGIFISFGKLIGLNDYFIWIYTIILSILFGYCLKNYWRLPKAAYKVHTKCTTL